MSAIGRPSSPSIAYTPSATLCHILIKVDDSLCLRKGHCLTHVGIPHDAAARNVLKKVEAERLVAVRYGWARSMQTGQLVRVRVLMVWRMKRHSACLSCTPIRFWRRRNKAALLFRSHGSDLRPVVAVYSSAKLLAALPSHDGRLPDQAATWRMGFGISGNLRSCNAQRSAIAE